MNTKVLDRLPGDSVVSQATPSVTAPAIHPSDLTRDEIYLHVIKALRMHGGTKTFPAVPNLDDMPWDRQLAIRTRGNALEPIEKAVSGLGFETDGTLAGIAGPLDLNNGEPHYLVCYCHEPAYSGVDLAHRLDAILVDKHHLGI